MPARKRSASGKLSVSSSDDASLADPRREVTNRAELRVQPVPLGPPSSGSDGSDMGTPHLVADVTTRLHRNVPARRRRRPGRWQAGRSQCGRCPRVSRRMRRAKRGADSRCQADVQGAAVDGDVAAGAQGFADEGVGFVAGAGVAAGDSESRDYRALCLSSLTLRTKERFLYQEFVGASVSPARIRSWLARSTGGRLEETAFGGHPRQRPTGVEGRLISRLWRASSGATDSRGAWQPPRPVCDGERERRLRRVSGGAPGVLRTQITRNSVTGTAAATW